MELALGTVQFGLRYGVAGRAEPVPTPEVRTILKMAWDGGIRTLDTAPAYGDIEARLGDLMAGHAFAVVSKIQPLPQGLSATALAEWAGAQVERSRHRLGANLQTLLFHRAEDLVGVQADGLWQACVQAAAPYGLNLGISCYDPESLDRISDQRPLALAQAPANAFDQRFSHAASTGRRPALHLRSAFLQGLLLMPQAEASARVPAATAALARWHAWCGKRGLSPVAAALGLVKSVPGATHCVVGVDGPAHLETILTAWHDTPPLEAAELAQADPGLIDPRAWPSQAST